MPYHRDQKRHEIAHLTDRIADAVYTHLADLTVTAWCTKEPVPYAERESGKQLDLRPGDTWGELFDCAWFRFTGTVPAGAAGKSVVLLIDVNGEACVVDADGNPVLGLTCANSEYDYSLGKPGKRVVPVAKRAAGGEAIDLWADAGCNDLFGKLHPAGTLKEARIAVLNPELHALSYDWEVLHDLMLQLPEQSARRHRIWGALCRAALELSKFTDDEAKRARAVLAPELAKKGGDPSLTVTAVGHSHIDLAWLWPLRETIRKGARTFATVLHNMEVYPDYVFGASQPQLYQWMKDLYPTIYAKVKERIAQGRWEVQGAMWVESDTNVPGGEALVRQLLYGKRFFRDEFGKEVRNLWLPDVFGYSGSLPQLLKQAGVDIFMTQKLSWSLVNRYPHHTFEWQGIDGSRVLAHLPPEDTYNSSAAPHAIAKAENGFLDKEMSEGCLLLFGIGDGGGGPGEEHLERLAREKNLAGLCPVVQEPAQNLFDRIAAEAKRVKLPVWAGELYLERHQGTFTTQARNKRYNRKLELALREAELACARATWGVGQPYPSEQLDRIWKEMLLYQFHDILPGSSITRVYTESLERYAALMEEVAQLTADADAALLADAAGDGPSVLASNSLSWERTGYVKAGGAWAKVTVPALGQAVVDGGAPVAGVQCLLASASVLENDVLRVELNADGSVRSVIDKASGREAIDAGASGNRLAVYEDPGDAWDFPLDYDDRAPAHFVLQSAEARIDGPEAIVKQAYSYGSSVLTQEVVLTAGSRTVEFRTVADWRETERMLRTSFPVAVRADEATFEIQFGSLRRPTHCNTTWDLARFEVCAQKYVDISERAHGVAVLNDCKYGHQVRENVIDIDLLRSPCFPDPVADRAVHQFTYALYPHEGDHVAGGVARAAYELNVPLRLIEAPGGAAGSASFVTVDASNVIVEAVKKAEDSDQLIVRLYEASGASVVATVGLPEGASTAELVDLMEENPTALPVADGATTLNFGPFEVHTVRIG